MRARVRLCPRVCVCVHALLEYMRKAEDHKGDEWKRGDL